MFFERMTKYGGSICEIDYEAKAGEDEEKGEVSVADDEYGEKSQRPDS